MYGEGRPAAGRPATRTQEVPIRIDRNLSLALAIAPLAWSAEARADAPWPDTPRTRAEALVRTPQVRLALIEDLGAEARDIDVQHHFGQVVLTGHVDTPTSVALASRSAERALADTDVDGVLNLVGHDADGDALDRGLDQLRMSVHAWEAHEVAVEALREEVGPAGRGARVHAVGDTVLLTGHLPTDAARDRVVDVLQEDDAVDEVIVRVETP